MAPPAAPVVAPPVVVAPNAPVVVVNMPNVVVVIGIVLKGLYVVPGTIPSHVSSHGSVVGGGEVSGKVVVGGGSVGGGVIFLIGGGPSVGKKFELTPGKLGMLGNGFGMGGGNASGGPGRGGGGGGGSIGGCAGAAIVVVVTKTGAATAL